MGRELYRGPWVRLLLLFFLLNCYFQINNEPWCSTVANVLKVPWMDPWPLLNLHFIRSISQTVSNEQKILLDQFGRNVSWYHVRAILVVIKSKFKRLPSAMAAWWYDWMLKRACLGCTWLNTYRVSFCFELTSQQETEQYSQCVCASDAQVCIGCWDLVGVGTDLLW